MEIRARPWTGLIFVQKMIGEKWVCILSGLRL